MTRRMPPTETVRMALTTLRSNRLRSLLTMVGIVITDALPITMPTIVSKLRSRLLRRVVRAILTVSVGGIRRVISAQRADGIRSC